MRQNYYYEFEHYEEVKDCSWHISSHLLIKREQEWNVSPGDRMTHLFMFSCKIRMFVCVMWFRISCFLLLFGFYQIEFIQTDTWSCKRSFYSTSFIIFLKHCNVLLLLEDVHVLCSVSQFACVRASDGRPAHDGNGSVISVCVGQTLNA